MTLNFADIGSIMSVEELAPLPGAVSWTDTPFQYYIHVIDRKRVSTFFVSAVAPSLVSL